MPNVLDAELRPQPFPAEEDGEFVRFDSVALFDEHVGDDGVHYDERLLNCIAENNNRRIRDTGDWCPVVIGHTSDDPKSKDPPVIGLAGPFSVQSYGNENPRPCIHATFWIWKEHADEFRKKYPRRSVEVWPEDKPENRYFDPIAVLGAETPKRDLGLIYGKPKNGKTPFRYSMGSAPGGSNTFLPGLDNEKQKHAKGQGMAFSPEDLQQIVAALEPMIDAKIAQMNVSGASPGLDAVDSDDMQGGVEGGSVVGNDDDQNGNGEPPQGMPPEMPGDDIMGDLGGETPDAADPADMALDAPPASPAEEALPDPDDEEYAKGLYARYRKLMKQGEDKAQQYMDGLGEEDAMLMQKYAKECGDDMGADKYGAAPMEQDLESDPLGSMQYSKGSNGDSNEDDMQKGLTMSDSAQHYRKRAEDLAAKYRKEVSDHNDTKAKYQKVLEENKSLLYHKRKAERKQELHALQMEGYCFDLDDELHDTLGFTDEQFSRHATKIRACYQKAPVGAGLPPMEETEHPAMVRDERAQKYAKAARDFCLKKLQTEGKKYDYAKVRAHVERNGGNIIESELEAVG